MAKGYRVVDREQQFLLPPDMRSWLAADHPVWVVMGLVSRLDTSALHALRRTGGVGRAGYDPDMLLLLMIWAWAHGVRSSRRIEREAQENVAYRIVCGNDAPDHVTISRFFKAVCPHVQDLYAQVLGLCGELGMGRIGVVAVDGVKIASNASVSANRTEQGMARAAAQQAERVAAARAEAARAAAEHAATDQREDALFGDGIRPDTAPDPDSDADPGPGPGSGSGPDAGHGGGDAQDSGPAAPVPADPSAPQEVATCRAGRIEQASAILAKLTADRADPDRWVFGPRFGAPTQKHLAKARDALATQTARQQANIDRWDRAAAGGRPVPGRPPTPLEQRCTVIAAAARVARLETRLANADSGPGPARDIPPPIVNLTDPQSHLQPLRGGGWLQGYNCQAVTSSDGLIIATSVSPSPPDTDTFIPMMGKAVAAAALITSRQPAATEPSPHGGIELLLADAGYLSKANLTAPGPDRLIAVGKRRALERQARENPATPPIPPIPTTRSPRWPPGSAPPTASPPTGNAATSPKPHSATPNTTSGSADSPAEAKPEPPPSSPSTPPSTTSAKPSPTYATPPEPALRGHPPCGGQPTPPGHPDRARRSDPPGHHPPHPANTKPRNHRPTSKTQQPGARPGMHRSLRDTASQPEPFTECDRVATVRL